MFLDHFFLMAVAVLLRAAYDGRRWFPSFQGSALFRNRKNLSETKGANGQTHELHQERGADLQPGEASVAATAAAKTGSAFLTFSPSPFFVATSPAFLSSLLSPAFDCQQTIINNNFFALLWFYFNIRWGGGDFITFISPPPFVTRCLTSFFYAIASFKPENSFVFLIPLFYCIHFLSLCASMKIEKRHFLLFFSANLKGVEWLPSFLDETLSFDFSTQKYNWKKYKNYLSLLFSANSAFFAHEIFHMYFFYFDLLRFLLPPLWTPLLLGVHLPPQKT